MSRPARFALPILWLVLSLLLSACQASGPDPRYLGPPAQIDLSSCGGEALWPLVGQPVAALPDTGGWGALRVIWPGMAVTEDYSESRLNVEVDAQGAIIGLSCG